MNSHTLQILLGPPEIADMLQVPEARINAVIAFGQAPKPTRTLNGKLKWKQADMGAWMKAVDSIGHR